MKTCFNTAASVLMILFLANCTYSVHLVNFSDDIPVFKKSTSKLIESKAEQFVIMGITDNTDYVNLAYDQLISKCPQGHIGAISTKYYTSHGFFSWTNHILIDGYCYN